MSADNWCICPKCKKKNDALNKQRILDAAKQYGVIPADEYIALAKDASKPIEIEDTFREDYDIGVYPDGSFLVSYRGQCTVCNAEYAFGEEVKFAIVKGE